MTKVVKALRNKTYRLLSFLSEPLYRQKDLNIYFLKMCSNLFHSAYKDKRDRKDKRPGCVMKEGVLV